MKKKTGWGHIDPTTLDSFFNRLETPICQKCGKNPVDTRIGDGSIWCRICNEAFLAEAMAVVREDSHD